MSPDNNQMTATGDTYVGVGSDASADYEPDPYTVDELVSIAQAHDKRAQRGTDWRARYSRRIAFDARRWARRKVMRDE